MKPFLKWVCILGAGVASANVVSRTEMVGAVHDIARVVIALSIAVALIIAAIFLGPVDRRKNTALDGFALSAVVVVVVGIIYPVFMSAATARTHTMCLSSMKQLATGWQIYDSDADDHFPPATKWRSSITPYLKNNASLHCPIATSPWAYAMNSAASGMQDTKLDDPKSFVDLFEANAQTQDAHGGAESFVVRHGDRGSVAFADGHATYKTRSDPTIHWKPKPARDILRPIG